MNPSVALIKCELGSPYGNYQEYEISHKKQCLNYKRKTNDSCEHRKFIKTHYRLKTFEGLEGFVVMAHISR